VACQPPPFRVAPPRGLDLFAPVPDDNPLTRGRVALGERLFFDPQLSADHSVSCSSCHRPARAFSDSLAVSRGVYGRTGTRNAPSVLNAAYRPSFFWDGRAATLEEQVLQPIQDSLEMGLPLAELEERVRASTSYRRAFRREFGAEPSRQNIARALAGYLRTLRSGDAPFDHFMDGDTTALSPIARRGFALFSGRAGCTSCHIGPLLSDNDFHNTGVGWGGPDAGRFRVTGNERDLGRFKVPSLRNVALTAPYMHDGSIRTLEDVVEFYDGGGHRNPNSDPLLHPLGLTAEEKGALIAFLRSLTSPASEMP
jgi:cytochrome c peroxidase